MRITFKYATYILLFLFSHNVLAQDFEIIKIQSAYYPAQVVEEFAEDVEIGFWEWSGQIAIPQLLKNNKTVFIHRMGYSNLRVELNGSSSNVTLDGSNYFHTIFYNFSMVQTLNPKWRLLVNVTPTLASDFTESLNDDDLLFQASALAMNTKRKNFKYGLGVAYTTRFGRQLIMPLGMIQYNTEKIFLDILLPNKLSVIFNQNKVFQFGFEAGLNGGLFNNNSDVEIISTNIDEAGYSRLNVGPTIAFKLKKAIKINLTGGMAVGRRLDFIDTAEETIDKTPANGPFFRVGLSFSPQKKNTKSPSI